MILDNVVESSNCSSALKSRLEAGLFVSPEKSIFLVSDSLSSEFIRTELLVESLRHD